MAEIEGEWLPCAFSAVQNKLIYHQGGNSDTTLFGSNPEPMDIFKVLLPKKVVNGICQQLNNKLKEMFKDTIDEKNLRKKFFKADQMYEYFGVKILMGFCRMPDPEDYFSNNLPFRNRIGELIKEGRFKCVASLAEFSDEILPPQKKSSFNDDPYDVDLLIPRIMKKVNKIQKKVNAPGGMLSIVRDQYFELNDPALSSQISAVYLQDVATEFIQQMSFQTVKSQSQGVLRLLETYKHKNHRVYVEKNLMTLNMIHHLALRSGVYCHAVVKNSADVKFNKAELMVNGPLTLYLIKQKDPT
jgi:Transposase IS4